MRVRGWYTFYLLHACIQLYSMCAGRAAQSQTKRETSYRLTRVWAMRPPGRRTHKSESAHARSIACLVLLPELHRTAPASSRRRRYRMHGLRGGPHKRALPLCVARCLSAEGLPAACCGEAPEHKSTRTHT